MSEGVRVSDSKPENRSDSGPRKPADEKAERLAEALRENLKRRKSQARDRARPASSGPDRSD